MQVGAAFRKVCVAVRDEFGLSTGSFTLEDVC